MLEVPLYFIVYHVNVPYYCTMERLAYIKLLKCSLSLPKQNQFSFLRERKNIFTISHASVENNNSSMIPTSH